MQEEKSAITPQRNVALLTAQQESNARMMDAEEHAIYHASILMLLATLQQTSVIY